MQWNWLYTASWEKPKIWTIAVPKEFDFWTEFKIPALGNLLWKTDYIAQDRGWAIKTKWDCYKIDVYCWKWIAWKKLALELWRFKTVAQVETKLA